MVPRHKHFLILIKIKIFCNQIVNILYSSMYSIKSIRLRCLLYETNPVPTGSLLYILGGKDGKYEICDKYSRELQDFT